VKKYREGKLKKKPIKDWKLDFKLRQILLIINYQFTFCIMG